jgi:hypothetical protein
MHAGQGGKNMMGGHNGMMMGDQKGMMGDQNGMMMGGMGGQCSMAEMHALADVKIENTKRGAIIRMNAKNAAQVAQIQQMAQRMTQCIGSAEPTAPQAAPPAAKAP